MRYEADHVWAAIKPMLPNKPRGVPRVNDQRVLKASFRRQSEVNGLAARYLENNSVAAETFGLLRVLPGRCNNSEVQGVVSNGLALIGTRRSKPHAEKCRQ
jgi:hypothetical protein